MDGSFRDPLHELDSRRQPLTAGVAPEIAHHFPRGPSGRAERRNFLQFARVLFPRSTSTASCSEALQSPQGSTANPSVSMVLQFVPTRWHFTIRAQCSVSAARRRAGPSSSAISASYAKRREIGAPFAGVCGEGSGSPLRSAMSSPISSSGRHLALRWRPALSGNPKHDQREDCNGRDHPVERSARSCNGAPLEGLEAHAHARRRDPLRRSQPAVLSGNVSLT